MIAIEKVLWRVLVAATVLLAIATAAVGFFAPRIVERALVHELEARGLPDVRFDVRYIGIASAAFDGVELDAEGRLTASSLVATYSPLSLLRGEIETLQIEGAHWVIDLQGPTADLGPLGVLIESNAGRPPRARLPVRKIEVVASEVVVALPEQQLRVPVEGALERTPEGFRVRGAAMATSLPLDLSLAANADLRVVRHHGDWSVLIHDSRVVVESGGDPRIAELRSEIVVAGAATEERAALRAEQSGAGGPVRIAGLHASLRNLRADVVAGRNAGRWTVRGRADVGLASIVHAPSDLRIERASVSLPLQYPFERDVSGGKGRVRVGPVRWRGTTFPAVHGELVQRGEDVHASLQWPLTSKVSAHADGRIALSEPFAAELRIDAPPFALGDAEPVAELIDRAVKGSLRGKVAAVAELGVRDGVVEQKLDVELDDVDLTRDALRLRGVTGKYALDSVVPPRAAVQRLAWECGSWGKLVLGRGRAAVGLRARSVVVVESIMSRVGEDGHGGRLVVDGFRWAPGQSSLRLSVYAEPLALQEWFDLLGRDEVTGEGTLHGHVRGTLRIRPYVQVDFEEGLLVAQPGGLLELQNERVAAAVLSSSGKFTNASELQQLMKDRLLEAMLSLRYSRLRFELVPHGGAMGMKVEVAGQGTKGAQQEIGGVTIFLDHFEDALNQMIRLSGGRKERGHAKP